MSKDFLLKEEKFKDLRDRLLNSAAGFYEKLGALLKDDTDLPSRRALLKANYEVAGLANQVGRKEDALALHLRVLAGREALAKLPGADPATAVDVARSLVAVGRALEDTGKSEEALAAYERARSVLATSRRQPAGGRGGPVGLRRRRLCGGLASPDHRPHGRGPACDGAGPRPPGGPRRGGPEGQRPANGTGEQPPQPRHPADDHGQAGRGGGRVPQGAGDPAEAGRRQPRRHRIPQ